MQITGGFARSTAIVVVPNSFFRTSVDHGSNKDIQSILEILSHNNIDVRTVAIPRSLKGTYLLFRQLCDIKLLSTADNILFIHSIPGSRLLDILTIKLIYPRSPIYYRSHNAEFFHRLDTLKAASTLRPRLHFGYLAIRHFLSDLFISRLVSYIWCISRADLFTYWMRLSKNSVFLPYVSRPVTQHPCLSPLSSSLPVLSSFGTVIRRGDIALQQELNYYNIISQLPRDILRKVVFQQTSSQLEDLSPAFVEHVNPVDIFSYYPKISLLVLASELGRGCKTKIVDAIAFHRTCFIPYRLFERLDPEYSSLVYPYSKAPHDVLQYLIENVDSINAAGQLDSRKIITDGMSQYRLNLLSYLFGKRHCETYSSSTICILSVLYKDFIPCIEHMLFMALNNPTLSIHANYVCNINSSAFSALLDNVSALNCPSNLTINLIQGVISILDTLPAYPDARFVHTYGSYQHASALHIGLTRISYSNYRNLLIIDPDFIVLGRHSLSTLIESFSQSRSGFISAQWNPSIIQHPLFTPCPHFLLLNTSVVPRHCLDFMPAVLLPRSLGSPAVWFSDLRHKFTLSRSNFIADLLTLLFWMSTRSSSRDTGYRLDFIFKRLNIKGHYLTHTASYSSHKLLKYLTSRPLLRVCYALIFPLRYLLMPRGSLPSISNTCRYSFEYHKTTVFLNRTKRPIHFVHTRGSSLSSSDLKKLTKRLFRL
jgi:hypothetical protein